MKPKKFSTVFDLEIAIDMYFMDCDERKVLYTVEGLACALDMDRRTLLRYGENETHAEFNPVIKRAKRRILQNLVERALSGKSDRVITIFNLKNNFGYVDKTETESTFRVDPVAQSTLNALTLGQLEAIEGIIHQTP